MENKQETTKTKNITQKAKKIRSMIMMTLLCVLMMSAATYAWFTLSSTARATNLTMTVGANTGLQIAPNTDQNTAGTFGSVISFKEIKGELLPATTTDGITFQKPIYDANGEVTDVKAIYEGKFLKGTTVEGDVENTGGEGSSDSTEGYYLQYTFWLKALGSDATVKLMKGEGISDGMVSESGTPAGTYVLAKTKDETKGVPASAAVRMSFQPGSNATSNNTSVFEPNSDIKTDSLNLVEGSDYAKSTYSSSLNIDIQHNANGDIAKDGDVIKLTGGQETQVTLYVWIEGTDDQCVNQISAKDLIGQLVFTTEESSNSTGE